MWFLILFSVLIFILYLRIKKTLNYWNDRHVPSMDFISGLKNMTLLLLRQRSFVDHVHCLYKAYPNKRYYGIFQFLSPQLLIRDPELIKQITVKDFDHFTDRTQVIREDAEPIFTKNLSGLKGQKWRDMRSTLSPSFTSSKMKFLYTLIADCGEQFTRYFEEQIHNEIVDVEIKDAISRFTNDAIASTAFGITVDSLKNKDNEFFLTGKDVTNFGGLRAFKVAGYSIFPSLMRFFKVSIFSQAASKLFKRVINETIQIREEKGIVRPDMIHLLLEARKGRNREDRENENEVNSRDLSMTRQKSELSDDDIIAQAVIFFFAGFETTSTLLTFLIYELALNPDIQSKLQKEIGDGADRTEGKLNYESVMEMKYLDMVVSEALRKWSPGVALDRVCVKDYEIPSTSPEETSVIIEKGTTIFMPILGIHKDPQYYPNPDKFDPERFSDLNKNHILPTTYIPFGVGPRSCIASRFALMEIKILLCQLLLKFDVTPTAKTLIPMVVSKKNFSMVPDEGIWLGFKEK